MSKTRKERTPGQELAAVLTKIAIMQGVKILLIQTLARAALRKIEQEKAVAL